MDEESDEQDECSSEMIPQRRKIQGGFPLVKSTLYALHDPRRPDEPARGPPLCSESNAVSMSCGG